MGRLASSGSIWRSGVFSYTARERTARWRFARSRFGRRSRLFCPRAGAAWCRVVAMEACASAHHCGREIGKPGHEVKPIPPVYVKPFVKRQKNDAADAEAICEAASRPNIDRLRLSGTSL